MLIAHRMELVVTVGLENNCLNLENADGLHVGCGRGDKSHIV